MLEAEQWEKIEKKYGMLMHKISHQISGDSAIASFEDNLQDIKMSAVEAVKGFEKQNEGANGKFDDFWGSVGFDKYIKTCMWTKKNNKGAKITKKAPILRGTVPTHKEEVLSIADPRANDDSAILFEDLHYRFTPMQRDIVHLVVQDPTLIKAGGKLNIKRLSDSLGISWFETNKAVHSLSLIHI